MDKTASVVPPIHVFRAGVHLTNAGEKIEFTEADIKAIAAAYDPAVHEAPFVIGHPKLDAPAYGWSAAFSAEGGDLYVTGHQVNAEFAEMVSGGAFKKRSLALYRPTDPANPKPGNWYPQHIGFLGANAPAIKGLKEIQFSESPDLVRVEFSAYSDRAIVRLLRGFRDWLIGKEGQEVADQVLPGYELDSLADEANRELATEQNPGLAAPQFSQPNPQQEPQVTPEQAAALEAENTALKHKLAAQAIEKTRQLAVAFAEGLVTRGSILPAERNTVVGLYELTAASQPVQFGEGDGAETAAPLERLQALLNALPKRVEFGEVANGNPAAMPAVHFAAPDGRHVDPDRLEVHAKALAHQKANPNVSYLEAVTAVQAAA